MAQERGLQRLDKLIAAQTSLSRRQVHQLLSRGQVTVNGQAVRRFDAKADPDTDQVALSGQPLALKRYSYLMLHKPQGVVCATQDRALPTVLDLVPEPLRRSGLFPAGRLDKDTTGFVLITNDGEFAHRILSPRSHVPKVYTAWLDKPADGQVVQAFAAGMQIGADRCLPARLELVDLGGRVARVTLREGMYHQIKRMFGAFGIGVQALHREQIGGLKLDPALPAGKCRELDREELEKILRE